MAGLTIEAVSNSTMDRTSSNKSLRGVQWQTPIAPQPFSPLNAARPKSAIEASIRPASASKIQCQRPSTALPTRKVEEKTNAQQQALLRRAFSAGRVRSRSPGNCSRSPNGPSNSVRPVFAQSEILTLLSGKVERRNTSPVRQPSAGMHRKHERPQSAPFR